MRSLVLARYALYPKRRALHLAVPLLATCTPPVCSLGSQPKSYSKKPHPLPSCPHWACLPQALLLHSAPEHRPVCAHALAWAVSLCQMARVRHLVLLMGLESLLYLLGEWEEISTHACCSVAKSLAHPLEEETSLPWSLPATGTVFPMQKGKMNTRSDQRLSGFF